MLKYHFLKKILLVELSHKFKNENSDDVDKIKNLLLLDSFDFAYIYLLLKTLKFDKLLTKEI